MTSITNITKALSSGCTNACFHNVVSDAVKTNLNAASVELLRGYMNTRFSINNFSEFSSMLLSCPDAASVQRLSYLINSLKFNPTLVCMQAAIDRKLPESLVKPFCEPSDEFDQEIPESLDESQAALYKDIVQCTGIPCISAVDFARSASAEDARVLLEELIQDFGPESDEEANARSDSILNVVDKFPELTTEIFTWFVATVVSQDNTPVLASTVHTFASTKRAAGRWTVPNLVMIDGYNVFKSSKDPNMDMTIAANIIAQWTHLLSSVEIPKSKPVEKKIVPASDIKQEENLRERLREAYQAWGAMSDTDRDEHDGDFKLWYTEWSKTAPLTSAKTDVGQISRPTNKPKKAASSLPPIDISKVDLDSIFQYTAATVTYSDSNKTFIGRSVSISDLNNITAFNKIKSIFKFPCIPCTLSIAQGKVTYNKAEKSLTYSETVPHMSGGIEIQKDVTSNVLTYPFDKICSYSPCPSGVNKKTPDLDILNPINNEKLDLLYYNIVKIAIVRWIFNISGISSDTLYVNGDKHTVLSVWEITNSSSTKIFGSFLGANSLGIIAENVIEVTEDILKTFVENKEEIIQTMGNFKYDSASATIGKLASLGSMIRGEIYNKNSALAEKKDISCLDDFEASIVVDVEIVKGNRTIKDLKAK